MPRLSMPWRRNRSSSSAKTSKKAVAFNEGVYYPHPIQRIDGGIVAHHPPPYHGCVCCHQCGGYRGRERRNGQRRYDYDDTESIRSTELTVESSSNNSTNIVPPCENLRLRIEDFLMCVAGGFADAMTIFHEDCGGENDTSRSRKGCKKNEPGLPGSKSVFNDKVDSSLLGSENEDKGESEKTMSALPNEYSGTRNIEPNQIIEEPLFEAVFDANTAPESLDDLQGERQNNVSSESIVVSDYMIETHDNLQEVKKEKNDSDILHVSSDVIECSFDLKEEIGKTVATFKACASCGKDNSDPEIKLKLCSRCLRVHYCSRDCQMKDWKDGHKMHCI